jgi:hypothetical protein
VVIFDMNGNQKVSRLPERELGIFVISVRFLSWYNKRKSITTAQASYKVLEGHFRDPARTSSTPFTMRT